MYYQLRHIKQTIIKQFLLLGFVFCLPMAYAGSLDGTPAISLSNLPTEPQESGKGFSFQVSGDTEPSPSDPKPDKEADLKKSWTFSVSAVVADTKNGTPHAPGVDDKIGFQDNNMQASISTENSSASIRCLLKTPGYWTFTVSGSLGWVDKKKPNDPNASWGGAADAKTGKVTVVKLDIYRATTLATDKTSDEIIGRQMNYTAVVLPSDLTPTYSWSIPGTYVRDYKIIYSTSSAATSASVVKLSQSDLQKQSVTYYWVDGQDGRALTVDATVSSKSLKAKTTCNVKEPSCNPFSQVLDVAHVDYKRFSTSGTYNIAGSYIGLANRLPPALGVPYPFATIVGIYARHGATTPAPFASTGSYCWVQLIQSEITTCVHSGWLGDWTEHLEPNSGLDTTFPYDNIEYFSDSPGDAFTRGSYDYRFTDVMSFNFYVLYNPGETNSIYVPVAKGSWWWSAQGWRPDTSDPSGWVPVAGTLNQGSDPLAASHDFPIWTQNGGNDVLHWVQD